MKCRFCASDLSQVFLDLGSAPPSNAYLTQAALSAPEVWLPLRLMVCESCWLVQTQDFSKPEAFFSAHYAYFSSMSAGWLAHAATYATDMTRRFGLTGRSLVCEVASNDGYLLRNFQARRIPCFGVEPTANTAAAAREIGLDVVESFFGRDLAARLVTEGRSADLTAANNVLAHVPDISDFVGGFSTLLKPQGVATFEFPHLLQMVGQNQFDTAYHEHFSYLSFTVVDRIFGLNGLTVFDVEEWPTHGGSLRVFAQRTDTGQYAVAAAVGAMRAREAQAGIETSAFYAGFQARAERIKDDLTSFLIEAKRSNVLVAAYGAAAKGNTLLNFAGTKSDLLVYVVDRAPSKQGSFLPGSRIPIVSEDRIYDTKPGYILILPWNLKREVMAQLEGVREWGAKFVTTIPSLKVE